MWCGLDVSAAFDRVNSSELIGSFPWICSRSILTFGYFLISSMMNVLLQALIVIC